MDTQPKIPTLKDSQKPQVKVRGLEAGVTLFDRLKQFKKKDLAFILAGLGTLFMAPLAEHFMMSPEAGDSSLQPGWGGKGGAGKGMFDGSGANVYEPGVSGLAPGQQVGGGSDIITPLNVRDPSALVMGPGATQQPPTSSVMPATPPPTAVATHSDSDLKDALAASARGVGAAAHAAKALLPIPKIALSGGSGLRGLGVVSSGSSASGGGISSAGLAPNGARQGNNLGGVTGGKGITGVARGQTNGGGGALDALKAAGDKAAGAFNRAGANAGLNDAANTAIPTGGGSLGGNGAGLPGGTDKANGSDQNKDGKNIGESLAFLKAKAIQDAQIALWTKEQEAGDNKLEALKIRNSMAEAIAGKIGGAVGDKIGCVITPDGTGCPAAPAGAGAVNCVTFPGGTGIAYPASSIAKDQTCTFPNAKPGEGSTSNKFFLTSNGDLMTCGQPPTKVATGCNKTAAGDGTTPPPGGGPQDWGNNQQRTNVSNLVGVCTSAKTDMDALMASANGVPAGPARDAILKPGVTQFYANLKTSAGKLIAARDAMFNGPSADLATCGGTAITMPASPSPATPYTSALDAAKRAQQWTAGASPDGTNADGTPSAIAKMKGDIAKKDAAYPNDNAIPGLTELNTAEAHRANAVKILTDAFAQTNVTPPDPASAGWDPTTVAGKKAATYTAQLTSAKTALQNYKGQLDGFVADSQTLDGQQKLLEHVVKPTGDPTPYLKTDVATNVAYDKTLTAYKAITPPLPDVTPAAAATPVAGAGTPPAAGTDDAAKGSITTAKTSVGGPAGTTPPTPASGAAASVQALKDLPPPTPATQSAYDTAKTKAQTDMGAASRDVTAMQNAQGGFLDTIGTAVRSATLPAAPTATP